VIAMWARPSQFFFIAAVSVSKLVRDVLEKGTHRRFGAPDAVQLPPGEHSEVLLLRPEPVHVADANFAARNRMTQRTASQKR